MTDKTEPSATPPLKKPDHKAERQARLNAALRDNLRRRKAADAARTEPDADDEGVDEI